jgi:hypothetical protein
MKRAITLLATVLGFASALSAQTSCGATFPSWMQCNNVTQTLYVPSLALTGGSPIPAGLYLASFDGNDNLTWSKYTPEAGAAAIPVTYPGHITFPAQSIAPYAYACQGFTIPASVTDAIYAINPTGRLFSKALQASGFLYNPGTVSYCLYNASPSPVKFTTAQLYTVLVTPVLAQ